MIARLVAWSSRNLFLVLFVTAFAVGAGIWAVRSTPLDAIPDLSDTQVIVYTEMPGQSPQVIEDQVTYPLTTALLSVPRSKAVRGFSYFGVSFVYIVFEDGTDIYWARSRVLEYLNGVAAKLPADVTPTLGPDATGVGWIYQYVVQSDRESLVELRALQDWDLRYRLAATPGVAEVASVGGYVRQYQIVVDPVRLRSYGLTLAEVRDAVRASSNETGGRVIEMAETEFILRGRGYVTGLADLERVMLKAVNGTPVFVRDVARVELGPDERRGVAELNGQGEAVSGIVIQRDGENALDVIRRVKAKLEDAKASLPPGTVITPVYDRSELIERAIDTLRRTLIEESAVVALVCLIFLLHVRSALVAILMLPVGVLIAFLVMRLLGVSSNIMSLGGIAIAIGAMVDAAIVMIENAHKQLERSPDEPRLQVLVRAAAEVGPALFFSLLIITVSFLPVFTLEAQEGRLFRPLAFTKTFAMAAAAFLSVTLVPALMVLFVRGRILPERRNPINRALIWLYRPIIATVLRVKGLTIVLALLVMATAIVPLRQIGSEFMPKLNEGTLLFMPVTLPGISITAASQLLQTQDRILAGFPEVASVLGKAGRANTATDPAPMEMTETVITLKPESEWRPGMTLDALIDEMNRAVTFPGVSNAWTMPISARIDMLSTGIRTPVGVKIYGQDLGEIERLAGQVEAIVREVPGTTSAFAERVTGAYYLDIVPDREALARYGVSIEQFQDTIRSALGGETVATTVEGRRRFTVNVRYPRDLRSDPSAIATEVLVEGASGLKIPLGAVARLETAQGPSTIRTENAQLAAYVFIDMRGRDIGGYVREARRAVADRLHLPPGYRIEWSGQFEYLERAQARLTIVVPVTLAIIFVLLYLNFGRLTETLIVMLSVPFSLVGGLWLMAWLGFNMSVAVAVGFIALAGVAAQTGVVMLIYLDNALGAIRERRQAEGMRLTREDVHAAVIEGAVERVRPKAMTVAAILAGLLPLLWAHGTGSKVMQRIAVPMIGGMASSVVLTLVVIPAIYALVKSWGVGAAGVRPSAPAGSPAPPGRRPGPGRS
ncbi:efflux RND transporter permease subunit [Oleomonas cavernae]|uniref:Efflux RND transporter permease subunit n=1 Tax=Oleomonas cavernae TaxID=2320859 RepID=A0A418WEF2_9PROT|nr:CusA/CzcA family heavy metal efflux RND transporter [Oleomonas cavernae]RJF88364.1 efflux RND transporter permease subunit [Oleomonas cavernae]